MATKWAIANGNWNAGATWNDGVVPAAGDDVYLDGHTVTLTTPNAISVKSLNNTTNPNTLNSGGVLNVQQATKTITADINAATTIIDEAGMFGNSRLTIIGNINASDDNVGTYLISCGSAFPLTINGNINLRNAILYNSTYTGLRVDINGNITANLGYLYTGTNQQIITINGNCETCQPSNLTTTTFIVNGNLSVPSAHILTASNLTVGGNKLTIGDNAKIICSTNAVLSCTTLEYTDSSLGMFGMDIRGSLSMVNLQHWTNISSPRTQPYIIITDYEMNDTQQYPQESDVKQGVPYVWGQKVGTYTPDYPQEAEVLQGVTYDNGNKTGTLEPVVLGDYPDVDKVLVGTIFDYGNKVGAFQPVADYPAEADVLQGVEYAYGQMTGAFATDYPPESVVLKDYEYGDSDDRKTGTMEQEVNVEVGCVTPEDVRKDVPLVGMGVVGTLIVPSVDDVREGVVFDNGSVGTLIVQGGGDRLRIADFSYYTNAQSDTYIVDLTEQDKPKFAVAEERVLIEMFPDLDLDNIPEKYFDDLFVKYLKYRLIVEYYRTAGINSTFTPSEPTTEIVNYQNVRNEIWLNSANIYLKAWAKKYPDSITKPHRILL